MPQLNPAPWLMILLLSWTILLTILQTKTLMMTSQNLPIQNTPTPKASPWNWPWI